MPKLFFTQQLRRFVETADFDVQAVDLRALLEQGFVCNPRLRQYVLDEQAHVREHVAIFIDGERLQNRANLNVPLHRDSVVYVLQALSGG